MHVTDEAILASTESVTTSRHFLHCYCSHRGVVDSWVVAPNHWWFCKQLQYLLWQLTC